MLARAHHTPSRRSADRAATTPAAAGTITPVAGESGAALLLVRYLDVWLVLASVPFGLVANTPRLGFAIGAATWIVTRVGVVFVKRAAWTARDLRMRAALQLTAILGRVWIVAAAVLLARFAGGNSDGIAAACVVLAAFTVELVMSLVLRSGPPASAGSPS
jgi:hypothetical protein